MSELNDKIKATVKSAIPVIVRQKIQPRKIHAFCVGTPKSGTTSIAGLFKSNYRVFQEPERPEMVARMYAHYQGELSDDALCLYYKNRDKQLWLDMESNCFLGYRPDLLHRVYPGAYYILTARAPKTWLGSIFDNNINFPGTQSRTVHRWHEVFFEPQKYSYTPHDEVLKAHRLYPLKAYLRYWVNANKSVLDAIPEKQLLVLSTGEIKHSVELIADFLRVSADSLDVGGSHLHKTRKKHNILDLIDQNYIVDQIEAECGELQRSLIR